MGDMPNDFWAGWIAVITIVSLLGLAWLVVSIYFFDTGPQEAETQVWDETLSEGANAAPMWWFWMILILMVVSVAYLMFYPGLGSFRGVLAWSQGGHFEHRSHSYAETFNQRRTEIAAAPLAELQEDAIMMQTASRIYDRNCAVCHGPDATGQASMFPDLTDNVWQWGGSAADIERSIRSGRNAVMVGWAPVLGEAGLTELTEYVLAMGTGDPGSSGHPGQPHYQRLCVACHGADGGGNTALGAPSLIDEVWLYGKSEAALRHSVGLGRMGIMPAFDARLDDAQIRLLVAWLTRMERSPAP